MKAAAARSGSLGTLALIGPLADSKRDTLGPLYFAFKLDETETVLEGIRSKVAEDDHASPISRVQKIAWAASNDALTERKTVDGRATHSLHQTFGVSNGYDREKTQRFPDRCAGYLETRP